MALRAKVLQKKAEKFELKKLQLVEVTKEGISTLDTLLEDVYANQRPKPTEYEARKDLVRVFNEIAKELYGTTRNTPVVVEFGSFVMDLFSNTSDLDLSVNFSTSGADFPREKKIQTLRKFARKLYAIQSMGHICGVLPITTAKVPILKCVDRGTGVECDISVENRDGISKSLIIGIITSIDERFKKLSFLMKTWAKAHSINSSKDKTLNSLSIILLVAFHLQTRNPPILPPFSAIFKDGSDPAMVAKSISNFVNYGRRNKESLAELFITLLIKLSSVEKLWPKGICASTYYASWISKSWNSKVACISVEDFTDQSQNVARAVGPGEAKQIYKCIDTSIQCIASFMGGQLGVQLKDVLFGVNGISSSILGGVTTLNHIPSRAKQTRGKVTGKRKKKQMQSGTFNKKSRPGTQSLYEKQVQEAILVKTSLTSIGMGDGRCTAARGNPTNSKQWGESCAGGWEQKSAAGGWEQTCKVRSDGWGVSLQNVCGDWGAMRQQGGGWVGGNQQQNSRGWEGGNQQQNNSQEWGGGGWEIGNQQQHSSREWGGGGWERGNQQQHSSGEWGGGGWERGHQQQLCSREWGGGGWIRGNQQQPISRSWGGGGWEGTQKPSVWRSWGGTQQGSNL